MEAYPDKKLMLANAYVTLLAWLFLLLLFIFPFIAPNYLNVVTSIFFLFASMHLVLALILKCPNCNKRPTVQGFSIHPNAEKAYKLNGWAAVIVRVAFDKRFRCIHCAKDYKL